MPNRRLKSFILKGTKRLANASDGKKRLVLGRGNTVDQSGPGNSSWQNCERKREFIVTEERK